MNLYDKASLIITPNDYKAGKIYALKPTSGAGDLTFARAALGSRRNSIGLFESLANNLPSLNYPIGGGCPSWPIQSQRTNIFLNPESPATQNITVVAGQVYTITTFGSVTATCSGAGVGVASNNSSLTFTASSTTLTVTISGLSGQAYVNCGLGVSPWLTPIMSGASATTRLADFVSLTGASALIGSTQGSLFCEFIITGVINKGNNTFVMIDNGVNNYIWFRKSGTNLQVLVVIGGSVVSDAIFPAAPFVIGVNKVAFAYRTGERVALFINGQSVLNSSNIVAAFSTFGSVGIGASTFGGAELNDSINTIAIYNTRLTNAELSALTT